MEKTVFLKTGLTPEIEETLISFSKDWEAENSCWGYRRNFHADLEGRTIFLACEGGEIIGYLFGIHETADRDRSFMEKGTPFFDIEELYVVPEKRSKGIGKALFRYAEEELKKENEIILLSTATKNHKAILHFYLDELDMEFWSASLFKRIS